MAKKRTTKTEQLLNMSSQEFSHMTKAELQRAVRTLARTANKNLKGLNEAEISTPASRYMENSGGRITSSGKTLNQLRAEFVRARDFIESKTGSVETWEKVKRKTIRKLKKKDIDTTSGTFDKMWKAYEKLKETNPEVANANMKYLVLGDIASMARDRHTTAEDIAIDMEARVKQIYEEQEERIAEDTATSDFIEYDDEDELPFT